ncbi:MULTISPECIES: K+/H+ antiporter subunit F [unclassified Paracoccus (in: a-proteobacteria)]|uniref:K+/H+ antiporter subunit F n=1 Tax=unclassified Paracoccus (in: a-proteobacteria) TaxID=2688777 RepID=UPI0015FFA393|nr:K+/H+ antiporter subunit F [Paracoccus sp. MC1862]MBB1491135.1 K+/H+ antiporter subunit F [Paracoccus sp. MC1854]MBB1497050.1 K+/H+ antiporter subunit F [Paracoccus sp. MC1862]QQO46498.1 K+/H+ antiporter subunit F [Paracoccus sp. MC1862]
MLALALWFAFGCFALAQILCLYRLMRAPGFSDRVLALDTMTINMIALITLFGIQRGTTVYFETSMLFALFGFVSTVAFAKFILRGDIIE